MSSGQPLVSIVTPVYNAERFLPDTIKTVQDQTYGNWEWLLVDDQSSDRSVEIIKEVAKSDERIKLIQNKENLGAAKSRNEGTKTAKGKYLAFLDADDLWHSTKLAMQVDFMQQYSHSFTFTDYEFADENGKSTGRRAHMPVSITYHQSLKNHIIWTSTVMIDLNQVPKETAFMPDVRRGQDTATWWRILRRMDRAHSIGTVLSYYRRTNDSLSSNKLKAMKRTWYLFRGVERLSLLQSMYNFCWYGLNAVWKRM